MHNIRLLCGNPLDLCRHKRGLSGGGVFPNPERLQTAMSLYSDKLSALVLMVNNRVSALGGITEGIKLFSNFKYMTSRLLLILLRLATYLQGLPVYAGSQLTSTFLEQTASCRRLKSMADLPIKAVRRRLPCCHLAFTRQRVACPTASHLATRVKMVNTCTCTAQS